METAPSHPIHPTPNTPPIPELEDLKIEMPSEAKLRGGAAGPGNATGVLFLIISLATSKESLNFSGLTFLT